MRFGSFAFVASTALLAACGGPETSQANNAQANVSNDARAENTAAASNVQMRLSLGDAAKVMHERHEGMETIGKAFKALHREFDSSSPFVPTVRSSSAQIASLARQASNWFPAGTGPEVGKTGAKPEIWQPQNKADFAGKLAAFQRAAATFNAAAASGDMNAAKARYADLGGACKACHDKYRSEMHH
jgi:cytochrome c556